jgi:lipopolysaccharide transport system ATP-binding protein
MHTAEVEAKFNEIVAFSGVEKFIDTPVKRYSSGMKVRLAFSVAAHLEPEILLVDEVLAVGDVEFQKKCLGKMGDVVAKGRTVLFVSHNMASIRQLCPECMWLENGQIIEIGQSANVIESYLKNTSGSVDKGEVFFEEDPEKPFQVRAVRLLNQEGVVSQDFECDSPVVIELICESRQPLPGLYGYLQISKRDGTPVMVSDSFDDMPNPLDNLPIGMHAVHIEIPARTLGPGDYTVYFNFASRFNVEDFNVDTLGQVCAFHMADLTSSRGNQRGGYFSTQLPWEVNDASSPDLLTVRENELPDDS